MLKQLQVQHFAIIDDVRLSFESGMTVLTGETGAGKSILIDAILLVLGDRASTDMIRTGFLKASISALFTVENERVVEQLRRHRIDFDDCILIEREITTQNKNTIKINQQVVTLSQLRDITRYLADVHSQFDTQRLIQPEWYLSLLDGFHPELIAARLEPYQQSLTIYQERIKEYHRFKKMKQELLDKKEVFDYQLKELTRLNLNIEEIDALRQEEKWMKNYDRIFRDLSIIHELFEEGNFLESFGLVKEQIESLSDSFQEFKTMKPTVVDAYYELLEFSKEVSRKMDSLNFDPNRLNEIQERLYEIDQIQKKYQKDLPELIEYRDTLLANADQSEHFDEHLNVLQKQVETAFHDVKKRGIDLQKVRQEVARRITIELHKIFQELVLPHTRFEVSFVPFDSVDIFNTSLFTNEGIDQIDFLISTNPGEPLKPLSKTVSGGEMSRIMLAFKTVFLQSQQVKTIVFDEIDTGISGSIAKQIAKKMRSIAFDVQVLSISHLPQVVAIAKHHLLIEKTTKDQRAVASARYLPFEERIQVIAEMISGTNPSTAALENAKELLINPE